MADFKLFIYSNLNYQVGLVKKSKYLSEFQLYVKNRKVGRKSNFVINEIRIVIFETKIRFLDKITTSKILDQYKWQNFNFLTFQFLSFDEIIDKLFGIFVHFASTETLLRPFGLMVTSTKCLLRPFFSKLILYQ